MRRLVAWLDGKFSLEVTRNLYGEKIVKRLSATGQPDANALRVGFINLKNHLAYIGWLAESRKWLAGNTMSLADLTAAGHLSTLDFCGDVDWSGVPAAHDWYARMKCRPSFRPLLADRVAGLTPPAHYADLDFLARCEQPLHCRADLRREVGLGDIHLAGAPSARDPSPPAVPS